LAKTHSLAVTGPVSRETLEEPPSLVALRAAIDARMPRVDLPEQVLEIHTQTSFAGEFSPPAKLGRAIAFS
jgi:hypothetical protein